MGGGSNSNSSSTSQTQLKATQTKNPYTSAKTEFVKKYTVQAKIIYGNRYE